MSIIWILFKPLTWLFKRRLFHEVQINEFDVEDHYLRQQPLCSLGAPSILPCTPLILFCYALLLPHCFFFKAALFFFSSRNGKKSKTALERTAKEDGGTLKKHRGSTEGAL